MKQIETDKQLVIFGELMMRLQTKGHERLIQAREFQVFYSGAEANVAVTLESFGVKSYVVSSVPDNAIGQACINYMRQYGLRLDFVKRNGFRLGIYFVETGAAQRPSTFLYNRKGSSITELEPGDVDWEEVFAGKNWFHFSGITPALGSNVAQLALEACMAARGMGLTISCDLNYRKNLWPAALAKEVMSGLVEHVDVLFTNEEEAATVFDIHAKETRVSEGKLNGAGYEDVAIQLHQRFNLTHVAISLRESVSATVNDWSGMIYDGKAFYKSRRYHIDWIVDRVGGGDAYSSAIIYGLLTEQNLQEVVEFAAAASCLKHSIEGDFNLVSFSEILALVNGEGSGRIQR
jgi:2-dehydro-3-deoxygluconokinase